jgi:hypothetical protein
MKFLLAVLFLVFSVASAAEMRLTTPDIDIVLLDTPCSSKIVLELLKSAAHPLYQNGAVSAFGRTVAFCWRVSPDGQFVWIVDEDGEQVQIPIAVFAEKATGVGI